MKKVFLFLLILFFAVPALAGFQGPGATGKVQTVKEASALPDDARVVLEGNVIRQLRHEHYIFKDASGEIEVEIDDDELKGIEINPQTRVRIAGEIDREHDRPARVDVDRVEIMK